EINAALASVKAEDLLPEPGGSVAVDNGVQPSSAKPVARASQARDEGWVPRPSPPRATIQRELIAATSPETIQPSAAPRSPLVDAASSSPAAKETDGRTPTINLASLTTDLPANRRRDAEALLGKLKAERDPRGLSMAVPGELLFAVNSEQIEPEAFDALASVAKLVDLYERRDVLIVGHTDAVGDALYNQQLSERRAALVKEFFVENFEISADRLQIEGRGEQDPISSNATADGRNANRRVEVVILE
ncbi:MAG: OmpA family protein, partial [Alphaproteobacteria bacterium]|nr:OmpA family protein [Alphaproteobacteria bacterium]